ncbi:hypothetical protein EON80_28945, partial [bacterium]
MSMSKLPSDLRNRRRSFLGRSAAFLGGALVSALGLSQTADAATWQKINSNSGAAGKWRKLNFPATGSGRVKAWGENFCGSFGNNTTTSSCIPIEVCKITNAIVISTGGTHAMALLANGCIMSWGYNDAGQLGDGTMTNRSTPV